VQDGDADLSRACDRAAFHAVNELGAYFFVKDVHRRFVACSDAFVRLLGYRSSSQIIGLRDEDISPEYLVDHYRKYDEMVINKGERIIDLMELVRNVDASYDWFITTKWPLYSGSKIVGVAAITRSLRQRQSTTDQQFPLAPAVELIAREYARGVTVEEMAEAAAMSPSHFTRRFKAHFGTTPHRYLRRVRLMAVCDLLSTTDMPLSAIARQTGHYDQSHMSNEFVRERGMTPLTYRHEYRKVAPPRRELSPISIHADRLASRPQTSRRGRREPRGDGEGRARPAAPDRFAAG
jgi:AraC-like DNA-binding protein